MLISPLSVKRLCCLFVGVLVVPISAFVNADVPQSSLKMPKASKSLLLDIEQIEQKLVVVGERGHILVSDDQGLTWAQADVPVAQMLNAVDFVNVNIGWAVGHDGNILHSVDGGETWSLQRDGLKAQAEANIRAVSAAKAKVKELQQLLEQGAAEQEELVEPVPVDGEDAEEALTLEEQLDEANWELETAEERLTAPAIAPPLMDVWFADENNGWAVGGFGSLLQTVDGGKTWIDRSKDINNTDGYHLNAVIGVAGAIFIAGEAGFTIVSRDNGQTWQKADLGYEGSVFGLFAPQDGSYIVATGLRGNTFRSEDAGMTWQALNPEVDYSLAGGFVSGGKNIVIVGAGGSIAVSNDGGTSFKRYVLPARASLSSVIVLENGQYLMVGQGGVYRFDVNSATE